MIKIFGIKSCNTMKKTFTWFDDHNIAYEFHDYKKQPPSETLAKQFLAQHPWDTIVNKRGTTWRKLEEETKQSMDASNAIDLIQQQPSVIKRPIIECDGHFVVGFNVEQFEQLT